MEERRGWNQIPEGSECQAEESEPPSGGRQSTVEGLEAGGGVHFLLKTHLEERLGDSVG